MATIKTTFSFVDDVSDKIKKMNQNVSDSVKGFESFSGKLVSVDSAINLFKTALGGIQSVGESFQDVASYEMLETNLAVITGSVEKAKEEFEELKTMAAVTPFDTAGLVSYATQLQAVGVPAEEVIDTLTLLGDTAMGDSDKMSRIVANYAQILSTGVATMQDMRQFAGMGLPVMRLMKEYGVKEKELTTAEQVKQMFKDMAGEGGMFSGGMEKGSQTLNGLISTLGDSFVELKVAMGNSFLPMIKDIVNGITNLLEIATNKINAFKSVIENNKNDVVIILGGVGTAIVSLGAYFLILKRKAIASAVSTGVAWAVAHWQIILIVGAVLLVIGAIVSLLVNSETVFPKIGGFLGMIGGLAKEIGAQIKYYFGVAIEAIVNGFLNMKNKVVNAFITVFDFLVSGIEKVAKAIDFIAGTSLSDKISEFRTSLNDMKQGPANFSLGWEDTRLGFSEAIKQGKEAGSQMGTNLSNSLNQQLDNLTAKFNTQKEAVKGLVGTVGDLMTEDGELNAVALDKLQITEQQTKTLTEQSVQKNKIENNTITPSVNLNNVTIENDADIDSLIDRLSFALEESSSASLY